MGAGFDSYALRIPPLAADLSAETLGSALARDLESVGLELLEDRGDRDLVHRYDPQGLNRFNVHGERSRIARARVRG